MWSRPWMNTARLRSSSRCRNSRRVWDGFPTDGSLTDRRVWADLASPVDPPALRPDGCALDAEGHIWSADAGSGRCYRIAPDGTIVDRIDPPAGLRFFACMLGGSDGRTLLGCAARGYYEAIE